MIRPAGWCPICDTKIWHEVNAVMCAACKLNMHLHCWWVHDTAGFVLIEGVGGDYFCPECTAGDEL